MKFIPNGVSSKIARQILTAKKNSPGIMFVSGVAGMVGTVVLASKATLKLDETLNEVEKKKTMAGELHEQNVEEYTDSDYKKDMVILRARTALEIGKLYAPAIIVGVVSVGLLTGAHVTLTRQNLALTAAYAALEKGFNEYRARVTEEYGADKDREFMYSYEMCEIEDEKGKKTQKKVVSGSRSPYARLFGRETSDSWSPQPEYNVMFLRAHQTYANDLLQARGHVFLNDVYDSLGLARTSAGSVTGWVKGNGDNYIDFGIFNDEASTEVFDFLVGREDSVWLDFNVDGLVYNLI